MDTLSPDNKSARWVVLRLESTGYIGMFTLAEWKKHLRVSGPSGWTEIVRTETQAEAEALRKLMVASQEGL